MTVLDVARQVRATRKVSSASVVRSPDALTQILHPEQNVCLLRRDLPQAIEQGMAGLGEVDSFERKRVVESETDLAWLAEPLGSLRADILTADLSQWLVAFRAIAADSPVTGCLVVTRQDECRKYHVDWVGLRLIVTYAGPGTEWVPNEAVRRKSLRRPWSSLAAINRRIVPEPARVMAAGAGDVLILKGESYPGNSGRGAVHRSPAIADSSGVRLVFKLTSAIAACRDAGCTREHTEHAG
jgi:Protein of unknown function (DUF1826)